MVRPTKLAQMFASRACRTSVMVGKPLSRRDMKKVETQYYYGGTVVTLYPIYSNGVLLQLVGHICEMENPWVSVCKVIMLQN